MNVVDINDHTPFFQHPEFFQTVPENLRDRNSSIFQVVAQDQDEGENARITYSITGKCLRLVNMVSTPLTMVMKRISLLTGFNRKI